jgi:hypothetical protein
VADGTELTYTPEQALAVTAVARGNSSQEVKILGKNRRGRMRIAYIFAGGHCSDVNGTCRRYYYGEGYDYEYENRNRDLGDRRAGDFDDRDTPLPMFRGNRAGPLS